jgi:ClpP class serine protease
VIEVKAGSRILAQSCDMNVWEFLWLIVLVVALQPVLARQFANAERRRAIARIERRRRSRLILLVHRQETVSFLGIPFMRYIDLDDAEAVARAIELTGPSTPIDFVIHTPGGLMLASVQIARALKRHKGKVTVFVPHYAMSGGALIALAADEIVMSPNALLGAVDPQVNGLPASSLLKVVTEKPIAEVDDETIIFADMGRKAVDEIAGEAADLLGESLPSEKAAEIAGVLTEGRWTHDYGLSAAEAKALGLPVSTAMPREILALMNLYRQPLRRTPSVEYSPIRRGPAEAPALRERHRP